MKENQKEIKEEVRNAHGHSFFEAFASRATRATGSTAAFMSAVILILGWLITGPIFHYSDTWQLVINTGTTIITFLMVFLIQKTQNKDSMAIQLKLNELVAASELASNRMVNIEDMTEEELIVLHNYYAKLAALAMKEANLHISHSIDEAEAKHKQKKNRKHT
ncbi:MAG: low affinity iron permease family protein [Cytophagaceae bacterium]